MRTCSHLHGYGCSDRQAGRRTEEGRHKDNTVAIHCFDTLIHQSILKTQQDRWRAYSYESNAKDWYFMCGEVKLPVHFKQKQLICIQICRSTLGYAGRHRRCVSNHLQLCAANEPAAARAFQIWRYHSSCSTDGRCKTWNHQLQTRSEDRNRRSSESSAA